MSLRILLKYQLVSLSVSLIFALWMFIHVYQDARRYFVTEYFAEQRRLLLLDIHPGRETVVEEKKKVLFATTVWNRLFNIKQIQSEHDLFCPERCIFSVNTSTFLESDALIFHGAQGDFRFYPRLSDQIWGFLWYETGMDWHRTEADRLFNWTLTFRLDSDVITPYGHLVLKDDVTENCFMESQRQRLNHNPNLDSYAKNFYVDLPIPSKDENFSNRHMVSWIASRCISKGSRREDIVAELRKYIPVHIYGKCADDTRYFCRKDRRASIFDCRNQISKQYLFYLAFENSVCEDYVTEKFFHTLTTEMIPIVYGGANYTIFPPKSYISVSDFKSIEALAKYLIHLSENKEEYYSYFEWRQSYCLTRSNSIAYCNLCKKLHSMDSQPETKTYASISKWWTKSRNINESYTCVEPETLPFYPKQNLNKT